MNNILQFSKSKAKEETTEDVEYQALRAGIKKAHPDWEEEKIEAACSKTIKKSLYDSDDEKARPGVRLPVLQKAVAKKRTGPKYIGPWDHNKVLERIPAIVVECYDKKGDFDGFEVHTPLMVSKQVGEYNDQALWDIVHVLCYDFYSEEKKRAEFAAKFIAELQKRIAKREEEAKEREMKTDGSEVHEPSNYQRKKDMTFGKSVYFIPAEADIQEEVEEEEDEE